MSTLTEIQEAAGKLKDEEKKALSLWLESQITSGPTGKEELALLRSLDEAIRDIDSGKGVPIEDVRKQVASWVAK